jgi:hypothetical protein
MLVESKAFIKPSELGRSDLARSQPLAWTISTIEVDLAVRVSAYSPLIASA